MLKRSIVFLFVLKHHRRGQTVLKNTASTRKCSAGKIEKEVLTMCTYTTSVKEKGFEEGVEKGHAGIIETLLKEGKTPAEINELIKVPLGEIEKVETSLLTVAQ